MGKTKVLPERFLGLLEGIAFSLEGGNFNIVNYDSLETEEIPMRYVDDLDRYQAVCGDAVKIKHKYWNSYLFVMPPNSRLTYQYMRRFVFSLNFSPVKKELREVLQYSKSFIYFNRIVQSSELAEEWAVFKHSCFLEYVYGELLRLIEDIELQLFEEEAYERYHERVELEKIPIPAKCMLCKEFYCRDEFHDMLCCLSRYDFDTEKDFQCGAFKSI